MNEVQVLTYEELATKLKLPVAWLQRHVKSNKQKVYVDWRTFGKETHFYRLMSLLEEMKYQVDNKAFIYFDWIVVWISEDCVFEFNLEGECHP